MQAFSHIAATNTFFHAKIRFDKIVEYTEVNNQPGFQLADTVNSQIDFGRDQLEFNPFNCSQLADGTSFTCDVTTKDGQFAVTAYFTDVISSVSGLPQKPTSIKFDVIINKTQRQPGTRMAILLSAFSVSGTAADLRNASREQQEGFAHVREHEVTWGNDGSFSWNAIATIGSENVTVINSDLGTPVDRDDGAPDHGDGHEIGHELVFSFDTLTQGEIVWDPKLNFIGGLSNGYIFFPSLMLIVTLMIALL